MKKLNRKGFTLIELMVVIAILVIIMGIALPNITSSIKRSEQKQKEQKIDLLLSEAELYFDRNSSKIPEDGIYVNTLISKQGIPGITVSDVCSDTYLECCITTKSSGGSNCSYGDREYCLVDDGNWCQSAQINDSE